MKRAVHHHNRGDNIGFAVASRLAQPGDVANVDLCYVLQLYGHAIGLRQRDILDVLDLAPLGQVQGPAAVDQADAPDIDRLLADIDAARADVHVRIADRGHELRQRDPVGLQLVEVGLDLVFLRGPAPGVDLHHAGNGEQAALQNPVLDGPEIGQAEMRGSFDLIAVNLADDAGGLNLRQDVVRKVDVLLKVEADLLEREIIVDAVVERDADEGQPVEGGRADVVYARRGGDADFDRHGIEALHLLSR